MTFGECLRSLRQQRKHTQGEVADGLGVPRTTYASWESDYRFPGDEQGMLDKIAEYFGVTVDYLLGRHGVRASGNLDEHVNLPPDLVEAINALPEEARRVFLRAKNLTPEGLRSVVDYIKFKLSEEDKPAGDGKASDHDRR